MLTQNDTSDDYLCTVEDLFEAFYEWNLFFFPNEINYISKYWIVMINIE